MRNLLAAAQYADRVNHSDDIIDAARALAADYNCRPLGPTTANLLQTLSTLARPAAALEVGTGTGVGTLSILRGMPAGGILTSIDTDANRQAVTNELVRLDALGKHRVRMITGQAHNVLGRLAPSAYDLVFIDGDLLANPRLVDVAYEKLAPHGVLIIHDALDQGNVAQPASRGPKTRAARQNLAAVEKLDWSTTVLLPVGAGLLIAVR